MKRAVTLGIVLAFVLAGCGLKVPTTLVAGSGTEQGETVAGPNAGTVDTGTGTADSGAGGTDTGTGGATDTGVGGDTGPAGSIFSSETEGVTNTSITICGHVPITGAAPIPHAPERFGQFYFNYVNDKFKGIYGRKVKFNVFDDGYYPAGARTAAEKCAREGAFMYLGAAGTDQIVSVAKWAERKRVPYFHGPTSDKDMAGFKYNIHSAMTYEAQHRLLAQYLVKRYGKNVDYGMVRVNSQYFDSGHDAYVDELRKLGVNLVVDKVVQKDEQQFADVFYEFTTKGSKGASGVEIINNFTTPNIWIRMVQQKPRTYNPTFTAVSPVAGFNIVAAALSGSGAKAVVLHNFNPACNCVDYKKGRDPSLPWNDDIDEFLTIFKKYSKEQTPEPDDFDYGSYLTAKGIHAFLLKLGPKPTRTGLFNILKTFKEDPTTVAPRCAADYTRGERRGGHSVNIFELTTGKWKQIANCVEKV